MPWMDQNGDAVEPMTMGDLAFPSYDMIAKGLAIGADPLPPPGLFGHASQAALPWWMLPVAAAMGVAGKGGKARHHGTNPPAPLSASLRSMGHPAPDRPATVQNVEAMLRELGMRGVRIRHTGDSTYVHFYPPGWPRRTKDPATETIFEDGQGQMFAQAGPRIRITPDGHAAHTPTPGEQGMLFDTAWRAGRRYEVDKRHAQDAQGRSYADIDVLREEISRRFGRQASEPQPPQGDPAQPELQIPAQRRLLSAGGAALAGAAAMGEDDLRQPGVLERYFQRLMGRSLVGGGLPEDWPREPEAPNPEGGAMAPIKPWEIPGGDANTGDDMLVGEQQITRDWLAERKRRANESPRSPR